MLNEGVIAGLIVMLCWGVGDFIQSIPIRSIGTPKTMYVRNILTILIVSNIGLYLYYQGQLSVTPLNLLIIVASSLFFILGYYMFMRGIEIGNLSVVSPISSSYSIITIILAIAILGESLPTVKLLLVCFMIVGVFLTSTDVKKIKNIRSEKGLKEALLSMVGLGLAFFTLGFASKHMNTLNIFIFASLSQAVLFLLLSVSKKGVVARVDLNVKLSSIFIIQALIVNLGWFAYIYGIGKNLVSIVTPLSSLFPGVTVLLALIHYKEKLVLNQKLGIGLILVSVVLIST